MRLSCKIIYEFPRSQNATRGNMRAMLLSGNITSCAAPASGQGEARVAFTKLRAPTTPQIGTRFCNTLPPHKPLAPSGQNHQTLSLATYGDGAQTTKEQQLAFEITLSASLDPQKIPARWSPKHLRPCLLLCPMTALVRRQRLRISGQRLCRSPA